MNPSAETAAKPGLGFGGIGRQLSTELLFMEQLFSRNCTVNNWTVWRKKSPFRSGQLRLTEEKLCSIRTTTGQNKSIVTRQKRYKLGWEASKHLIVWIAPSYYQLFMFMTNSSISENSLQQKLVEIGCLSYWHKWDHSYYDN